jgi:hypothetical protein
MANAIANHLQKKLLVVNFPSLGTKNMSELMRLIFREAKLYDAIIFFGKRHTPTRPHLCTQHGRSTNNPPR